MSSSEIAFATSRGFGLPTKVASKDQKLQSGFEGLVSIEKDIGEKTAPKVPEPPAPVSRAIKKLKVQKESPTEKALKEEPAVPVESVDPADIEDNPDNRTTAAVAPDIEPESFWSPLNAQIVEPRLNFGIKDNRATPDDEAPLARRDMQTVTKAGLLDPPDQPNHFPPKLANLKDWHGKDGSVLQETRPPVRSGLELPENASVKNRDWSADEIGGLRNRTEARPQPKVNIGEPLSSSNGDRLSNGSGAEKSTNIVSGSLLTNTAEQESNAQLNVPPRPVERPTDRLSPAKANTDRIDLPAKVNNASANRLNVVDKTSDLPTDRAQIHAKSDLRNSSVHLARSDENSALPAARQPNIANVGQEQLGSVSQISHFEKSISSSQATSSLISTIEKNSNWTGQLKAATAAASAIQRPNGQLSQTLRIHLHPVELGAVDAALRISGDKLHLTLHVDQETTLRSLTRDSQIILNAVRVSGLQIDELTISGTSQPADSEASEGTQTNSGRPQERAEDEQHRAQNRLRDDGEATDKGPKENVPVPGTDGLYI